MSSLRLADQETWADLSTYVARARRLEEDGAIRLLASGTALAAWVGVVKGRGLLGEGTTVGLRVLELAEPANLDVVVSLSAVADRLARHSDDHRLPIPPMTVQTTWAAVSPPRSGWRPVTQVPIETLRRTATDGLEALAVSAREPLSAVRQETERQRVWSASIPLPAAADGLSASVALGAHALGFLVGDEATVYTAGRWYRLTTPAGHVLVR
ncbi:hypothetical protein ATK17_0684 [Branchiibius hedensis]|uniref:Uncharacterized protein n=1 Tax=Branchiibius hedensis TaxID=672460 RepID=A0A2Y8ZNM7_9MICO|nr:hypothetical protein [Branchiibius hedensis]PWJ24587.1 hypothetical protein ATK17_0684 [Branchiibius hedensis]SSA33404.1 hypothetical protein SAMN04489750_0684 [Branchiibius hedensis]